MAWIFYTASSRNGALLRRNGRFADVTVLDSELSRRGETLIDYTALPDALYDLQQWAFGRMRPAEVAEFCRTLSMYVAGGVDLQTALQDLEAHATSLGYRRVVGQVRRGLMNGYPFSESLRRTEQFPEEVIALVRIGESSGALDRVLVDAADHIDRLVAIKSAVKRAVMFPAFTLVVMVAGVLFWLSFVMPRLALVFKSMNLPLPGHIASMITASDWVQDQWWLVTSLLVAAPIAYVAARKASTWFRYQTDRLAWYSPVFGKIVVGSQMAFWFQYMGLMYGAGVAITQAIDVINPSVKNRYFRARIASFNARLLGGEPLQGALRRTRLFEPLALRMIGIGEETGNLEPQMKKLAGIYFGRVTALVEVLAKVLEPMLGVLMAALLAFFVLGVLGPIYESVGSMGGGK